MAEPDESWPGRVDRLPFVGRAAELDRLDAALDHLERRGDGGPAVVDVTGDAGIGKSRLLTEFAARARGRGMTVLRGLAAEREGYGPFQPFADAFADLDQRALRAFPALAELPTAVRGGADGAGAPVPRDRRAVVRATAAVLRGVVEAGADRGCGDAYARAAGRVPAPGLVVLLDDLHWADAASLELLDHLVRHPVPAPFLLAVSRRARQSPPALVSALARGIDTGAVLRITLGPLGSSECVGELTGELPPERAAALYAACEGNPRYLLALLQAHRTGPGTAPPLDELAALSALERGVVEAVAVLGDQVTTDLVGAVTGATEADLVAALRQLVRRDLLRPQESGRRLALRHRPLQTLIRAGVDPWRRRELHRRAAAERAEAGAPLAEQAHHVEQSLTRWDPEAANVLRRAADQAAVTAPAAAARWLAVVLGVLPDTSEHRDARNELMLARAQALGMIGAVRESRDLLHELIGRCGPGAGGGDTSDASDTSDTSNARRASDASDGGLRTAALVQCAFMERHLGRYVEAGALLRRELDRRPGPPPSQRAGIVVEWGCRALFATRFPEVREELARTLADARARGDERDEAEALTLAAMGEAYEGDTAAARGYAEAAAALADVLTDVDLAGQCESLVRLGWSEVFLENYADAERHAQRGVAIARRSGRPFALSQSLLCAGYAQFVTGRVTAALGLVDESLAVAHTLGGGELLGFIQAIRAAILLHARPPGDPEVLAAADAAVATVGGMNGWWATTSRCLLAYAALAAGDPHRVRDVLLHAGGGEELPQLQPSVRPNFLELLATAALATGDTVEAAHWSERATKEAERLALPSQRGSALRASGQLAAQRGDVAAAARAFTEAARESARSGAALREAHSLLLGAPHVRAAGDGSRAFAMWRRGRRLAADGGALLLVELADRIAPALREAPPLGPPGAVLSEAAPSGVSSGGTAFPGAAFPGRAFPGSAGSAGSAGTTGSAGTGPASGAGADTVDGAGLALLTPREREISALVAEGLTNQAVADRLCLSPRTVESHVARVYRKTGISSRAALASLMARGAGPSPPE
ncbi:helix-turn-helix transcriptional regulator [Streptomyces zagrosensis]|uniref:DNA-binding CsgD family transcriptional regulator/tetratricopeptide (TPR) repeat protein n=1 Tax=Streptomyces zagrosensis TaxID=1042984 RepID=A0A7W9QGW6_9ACTN|nr:AAA family ATPase [Streptomyces zagrosensis]MBB5940060.1 DNA-binding CsgD family transcriptional regulator/tetratricopeptide (TPR) repeat protein [Streptomyces zagrosensis]